MPIAFALKVFSGMFFLYVYTYLYGNGNLSADAVYSGFDPLTAIDIAETVYFAATRPAHVNLNDIVIMPTAQASSTILNK